MTFPLWIRRIFPCYIIQQSNIINLMRKIVSFFMLWLMCFVMGSTASATVTIPQDGIYQVFWEYNNRGYLTYAFRDYPNEAQLADVTLSGCQDKHYKTANDGKIISKLWYLYTSKVTGQKYLFTVKDGKFLGKGADNYVNTLSAEPTPIVIEPSGKADAANAGYLQIKSGDRYLGSGCGSGKNQHPVRWNDNSQITDGGTPLKFVAAPADSVIDEAVKNNAIAKIDKVTVITNLKDVNVNKAYTLKATRGFLNAGNTLGASASKTVDSKFAFVTKDNGANYALYSVSKKKFLKSDGSFTLRPEGFVDLENITADKGENNVVIQKPSARIFFKNEINKNLNVGNNASGVLIDHWKTVDQGNDFQISEVETFNPLMALMGASQMQADGRFDANMQWFRINIGSRILNLGDDGNLRIDPANAEKKVSQLFSFVRTADNNYVVYNYAAGPEKTLWCANGNEGDPVRIANISGDAANRTWVLAANGDGYSVRSNIAGANNRYWNSYGGANATQIKIWKNNGGANDGSNRFYFHNVSGKELESYLSNKVTVTYSYTFKGKAMNKKQQVTAVVGAAFPRVELPVSYITAQYPDRKVTAADANKEFEISTSVAANLPFKLSADAQHLEWNAIKYKYADNKWLANEVAGVKLSGLASGTDVDNNLWAFVGDWANGYKVYNKKDLGKVLVAGNLDNGTGAQRHTTMKDAASATETESRWTIEDLVNGAKNVDFCLKLKNDAEVSTYLGDHTEDSFLSCWTNNSGNSNDRCKFNFQAYVPEALPVAGKNYFFVNLNSNASNVINKQYYYDNGQTGTLNEAYGNGIDYNHVTKNYKKYVWQCVSANGGKYIFKNLATGRFLDWKKMSDNSQAEWILNSIVGNTGKEGAIRQGCVTMWKVGQKFLVRKHSDNTFNQAGNAGYNNGDFSSDFKFEECTVAENELLEEKDIFSAQYGEKWLRVDFNRDNNYAMKVNAAGAPCTAQDNFGNADDLQWCFVKQADNLTFKIYSKQQTATKALNVENGNQTTAVTFVDAANACTWRLVDKGANGYAVIPAKNTTLSQSMNAFQGVNKVLKLYDVTDNGSWWMPAQISTHPFTFKTEIQGESYAVNTRVGRVGLNVGRDVNFTVNKGQENVVSYYLPIGAQVGLTASADYRGYKFVGFKTADGQTIPNGDSVEYTAEGMDLTAVFEADKDNKYQYLFYSRDDKGKPYRIPAMVTAKNGDIIAISDYRPCGSDIGYGEVDVKYRISTDGGQTWGPEGFVADGLGEGENQEFWKIGFGDAAVVADRESNKVLIMMVCGKTVCWNGNYIPSGAPNAAQSNPNRVARVYAEYDEQKKVWNFSDPVEVTNSIYTLFDNADHTQTSLRSLFIGSGRICQSRVTKKGSHYRLYCSVWAGRDGGNRVLYSDDFGGSWHILGTAADRPAPSGDEPKCEELPDGRVILSSRKGGGRYFNIFTFNDDTKTTGSWGQVVASNEQEGGISDNGQATNGEIISVQAMNMAGETKTLMLQSEPWGPGRSNVGIYFKEIDPKTNYTPATFAQHWTTGLQVSDRSSAYSTMTILPNGNVGFFFEESPSDYCMVYRELSMKEITNGAYTFVGDDLRPANIAAAEEVLSKKGVGYPKSGSEGVQTALDNYKKAAHSKETYDALQKAMNDYKSDVTNIQMPEDGKAYTFAGVLRNGTKRYMSCNENGVTWVADAKQATAWVCRVMDANAHTYAFVNNDNRFSIWSGVDNGLNGNKGYNPTFEADKCTITIEKMIKKGQVQSKDQAELFGYMTYKGLRGGNKGQNYMVNKTDNTFSPDGAGEPFFNNRFSSAILMEEVAYANTPKLNPILGNMITIQGAQTIGTFSAPFATVAPEGISAFYIKADGMQSTSASLTKVEGQVIPANQGVILTSGNAEAFNSLMLPATSETPANLEGNKLDHSAGAAKPLEGTFYLLGKYGDNVGLFLGNSGGTLAMNKAYLPVVGGQAPSIKLVWNEEATGIEGVEAEVNADAPIYDLSGRRVLNTVKGGIYIQNGKKFIVR